MYARNIQISLHRKFPVDLTCPLAKPKTCAPRMSPNFLCEVHISYYTIVRGPDFLCNAIVSGKIAFHQINTILGNLLFFHHWLNGFAGRMKCLAGSSLETRMQTVPCLIAKLMVIDWPHLLQFVTLCSQQACSCIFSKL